jgi:hypothetical protein
MLVSATVAVQPRINDWSDGLISSASDDVVADYPSGPARKRGENRVAVDLNSTEQEYDDLWIAQLINEHGGNKDQKNFLGKSVNET